MALGPLALGTAGRDEADDRADEGCRLFLLLRLRVRSLESRRRRMVVGSIVSGHHLLGRRHLRRVLLVCHHAIDGLAVEAIALDRDALQDDRRLFLKAKRVSTVAIPVQGVDVRRRTAFVVGRRSLLLALTHAGQAELALKSNAQRQERGSVAIEAARHEDPRALAKQQVELSW